MGEKLAKEKDIQQTVENYLAMDLSIFLPEILLYTENSGADSCNNSAPSSPLEVSHFHWQKLKMRC